jgi:integrase
MTRPFRHPKTGIFWVRKGVPAELRRVVGKRELKASLRTPDETEARRLGPLKIAEFEAAIAAARDQHAGRTVAMAPREVAAMVGDWYRQEAAALEASPGDAAKRDVELDIITDDRTDPGEPGVVFADPEDRRTAKELFAARGIAPDDATVALASSYVATARIELARLALRRAEGDWSRDAALASYPVAGVPAHDPGNTAASKAEALTGAMLLEKWARENPRSPATMRKYATAFECVAKLTGETDLRRLTPEAVAEFKQQRLAQGRNPGTVADEIITCGSLCQWGLKNRLLTSNPFDGMAPKVSRRGPPPRAPYDDADAARILTAARAESGWLRWVPWLLAFTGARLSEIVDLRRQDVRQEAGVWIVDVVPTDDRAGKNATAQRMIPLHPAVIDEGFLEYLAKLPTAPAGPLFPDLRPAPKGGRAQTATHDLGRWVRRKLKMTDARKAPAHSWRHRMEDELRRARVHPEVLDAITGRNNPRNAGSGYGVGFRRMPDEVLRELSRLPSPVPSLAEPRDTREAGNA